MAIKIVLFARDIQSATEVVEYALSMDCALVSYIGDAPMQVYPVKKSTYNSGARRSGAKSQFTIDCTNASPFEVNSVRDKVYFRANKKWPKKQTISRQEFNTFLRSVKITTAKAASIYKGFQEKGVLTPL